MRCSEANWKVITPKIIASTPQKLGNFTEGCAHAYADIPAPTSYESRMAGFTRSFKGIL
jgi:hypothetical protein